MSRRVNDHLLGSLTLFITLTLVAATMLLAALLFWLAQFLGSMIYALLIIGGVATLLSLILYFSNVRPNLRRMRDELSTIYEVAQIAKGLYSWVMERLKILLRL